MMTGEPSFPCHHWDSSASLYVHRRQHDSVCESLGIRQSQGRHIFRWADPKLHVRCCVSPTVREAPSYTKCTDYSRRSSRVTRCPLFDDGCSRRKFRFPLSHVPCGDGLRSPQCFCSRRFRDSVWCRHWAYPKTWRLPGRCLSWTFADSKDSHSSVDLNCVLLRFGDYCWVLRSHDFTAACCAMPDPIYNFERTDWRANRLARSPSIPALNTFWKECHLSCHDRPNAGVLRGAQ
jgi:hypothetical protein